MEVNENGCSKISSLRQLRRVRSANETARKAVLERINSEINETFSLGGLLVSFVQRYTPTNVKRFVETILGFSR